MKRKHIRGIQPERRPTCKACGEYLLTRDERDNSFCLLCWLGGEGLKHIRQQDREETKLCFDSLRFNPLSSMEGERLT